MKKSESLERLSLFFIGLAIGAVAGAIAIVQIPEPLSGYVALFAVFSSLTVAFWCSMKSIDAASEERREHWRFNAEYRGLTHLPVPDSGSFDSPFIEKPPLPDTGTIGLKRQPVPRRPAALVSDGINNIYETHYADDNKTITAVYCNGVLMEPRPKPRWWQFWRWGEIDPYRRW